ncbi:MAG: hypothetical protein WDN72_10585 [Alphaproteobacteria bacterium]
MHHAVNHTADIAASHAATLQTLSENVIYLMGLSFILGSLFTILILLLLDFMKRNRPEEQ